MKVGEYCYVKNARKYGIGKIYSLEDNNNAIISFKNITHMANIGNVISSESPIDLIEVGDYVNDNKIIEICDDFVGRKILVYGYDNGERQVAITIYEKDIKSIVTKECFENMKYKVKE